MQPLLPRRSKEKRAEARFHNEQDLKTALWNLLKSGYMVLDDGDHRRGGVLPAENARRVWRIGTMRYQFVALGVFCIVIGGAQFPRRHGELAVGITLLLGGAGFVVTGLRMALITVEGGLRVRNPFRTFTLSWSEVKGFRVGGYKLLPRTCIVDLVDGSWVGVVAIQVPSPKSKGASMLVELNSLAAQARETEQQ